MSARTSRGGVWVAGQAILFVLIGCAAPAWPGAWTDGGASRVAALLAQAAAIFLAVAGTVRLGRNLTPLPHPRPGARLVTGGIYGLMRHPLYVAVMLTALAWALWWHSAVALALLPVLILFMDAKARCEERWLREMFPAYDTYTKRVKRFLPGIY